jgi:predicted alpha/beta-fold hydrolase
VDALARVRTVRAFDERVIVPMHGFRSAEQYYEVASAGPSLKDIRVPTLIVHADDDPMVPGHTVRPYLFSALPSCVKVAWSDRGGHVGWYAGLGEQRWLHTWPMRAAIGFFERHRAQRNP